MAGGLIEAIDYILCSGRYGWHGMRSPAAGTNLARALSPIHAQLVIIMKPPRDSADMLSDTGALAKHAAGAANDSRSTLERVGETAAAIKLGSRILPAAWRFAQRRPWSASVAILAILGAVYLILPRVRSAQRD